MRGPVYGHDNKVLCQGLCVRYSRADAAKPGASVAASSAALILERIVIYSFPLLMSAFSFGPTTSVQTFVSYLRRVFF